jgi:hypothetical protein
VYLTPDLERDENNCRCVLTYLNAFLRRWNCKAVCIIFSSECRATSIAVWNQSTSRCVVKQRTMCASTQRWTLTGINTFACTAGWQIEQSTFNGASDRCHQVIEVDQSVNYTEGSNAHAPRDNNISDRHGDEAGFLYMHVAEVHAC